MAVRLRMKDNLRGKKQDPWRKANDQAIRPDAVLAVRGPDAPNLRCIPGRVREGSAGRQAGSGLRSFTRTPAVATLQAGFAARPKRNCNRSCKPA